jgi:hypothetical protein
MTEVELLFKKPPAKAYPNHYPCVLATFKFATRPLMQYRQEYQQGPVHVGRVTVTMRAYGWRQVDIDNYKRLRDDEDMELLSLVDDSVQAAMESLGDDLETYINDASMGVFDEGVHDRYGKKGPVKGEKTKLKAAAGAPIYEPFTAIFGGLWDIFTAFVPVKGKGAAKKQKGTVAYNKDIMLRAAEVAERPMWQASKNYRKKYGLLSW